MEASSPAFFIKGGREGGREGEMATNAKSKTSPVYTEKKKESEEEEGEEGERREKKRRKLGGLLITHATRKEMKGRREGRRSNKCRKEKTSMGQKKRKQ